MDMLTAKLSKTIGISNTLKHILPINLIRTIDNSLILYHLNYGVLLCGPQLHLNDRLHILHKKKAVRIITGNSYFAHSEPLFKQLRLLKTCDIYKCQLLKCILKLIYTNSYRIISSNSCLKLETNSIITPPEHVTT